MNVNYNNAEFVLSAFAPAQFITDQKPQIVFAGRSNVGKSSVINALCNRKSLARVGSAPGKTRSVNYFHIDNKLYFVDLPGYGYAKVSQSVKESWADLIEAYFAQFSLITLGILVVDARHKPTELDITMAGYFQQTCIPWVVLANKADKLKKKALAEQMECIRATLVLDPAVPLIAFSGEDKMGRNQAIAAIQQQLAT